MTQSDDSDMEQSYSSQRRQRRKTEPFLATVLAESGERKKAARSPKQGPSTPKPKQARSSGKAVGKGFGKGVPPRTPSQKPLPSAHGKRVSASNFATTTRGPVRGKEVARSPKTTKGPLSQGPAGGEIFVKASVDGKKVLFNKKGSLGGKKAMPVEELRGALVELFGFLGKNVHGCQVLTEDCVDTKTPYCTVTLSGEDRTVAPTTSSRKRKRGADPDPFDIFDRLPYYISTLLPLAFEKQKPKAKPKPPKASPKKPKAKSPKKKRKREPSALSSEDAVSEQPETQKRKKNKAQKQLVAIEGNEIEDLIVSTVQQSLTKVSSDMTKVNEELSVLRESQHSQRDLLSENHRLREELGHLQKQKSAAFEERARIATEEVRKREEDDKKRQILKLQKENESLRKHKEDLNSRTLYVERSDRYPHGTRLRKDPTEASRYKTYKDGKQVLVKANTGLTPCGEEQNGFTLVQTVDRHKGWVRTSATKSRAEAKNVKPTNVQATTQGEMHPPGWQATEKVNGKEEERSEGDVEPEGVGKGRPQGGATRDAFGATVQDDMEDEDFERSDHNDELDDLSPVVETAFAEDPILDAPDHPNKELVEDPDDVLAVLKAQ